MLERRVVLCLEMDLIFPLCIVRIHLMIPLCIIQNKRIPELCLGPHSPFREILLPIIRTSKYVRMSSYTVIYA